MDSESDGESVATRDSNLRRKPSPPDKAGNDRQAGDGGGGQEGRAGGDGAGKAGAGGQSKAKPKSGGKKGQKFEDKLNLSDDESSVVSSGGTSSVAASDANASEIGPETEEGTGQPKP